MSNQTHEAIIYSYDCNETLSEVFCEKYISNHEYVPAHAIVHFISTNNTL